MTGAVRVDVYMSVRTYSEAPQVMAFLYRCHRPFLRFLALCPFFVCCLTTSASSYTYYRSLTINQDQVPSDLANFPALVSLNLGSGKILTSQCYDVVFTSDAGGSNVLPFERDQCNTANGSITAWVQIPSINGISHSLGTTIYAFYGNSSIVTDPSNKVTLWNGYKAVYHLGENPAGTAPQLHDSTVNGYHLTVATQNSNPMTSADQVSGLINGSINFAYTDDYHGPYALSSQNVNLSGTAMTISAWVNPSVLTNSQTIGGTGASTWPPQTNQIGLSGTAATFSMYQQNVGAPVVTGATVLQPNQWYYIVGTYDGSTARLYVNGQQDGYTSTNISANGNTPLYLAYNPYTILLTDAVIDEFRASLGTSSPAWVTTEYNNQSSPAGFYNIGSETSTQQGETITTPSLTGPTSGTAGTVSGTFTATGAVSSIGHTVQYQFYWGDGQSTGWLPSGTNPKLPWA
jgi:hypothetical protein